MRTGARLLPLLCCLWASGLMAADNQEMTQAPTLDETASSEQKRPIKKIVVVSNAIFDESDPDAFFIHRWANYLHINTLESTILNKLSFDDTEKVSQKDLDEAQRILRYESYIRDAKISFAQRDPDATQEEIGEGETVLVETWDNWSLLPTFSASHSGGENKFSVGIKEDNLLGLGVRTRLKYTSDIDRTGYQLAFRVPSDWLVKHSTFSANFYDNSDGQATILNFTKPFYRLDSKNMYSAHFINDLRTDTIRQNGFDINEFEHQVEYLNAQYGWRLNKKDNWRSRIIVGVTQDKHSFDNIPLYPNSELPQDRDFLYPWVAYQFIEDDYRVLNNIYLINYNEDINLGWQHYLKFGIETQDTDSHSSPGYHFNWYSSWGYKSDEQLVLLRMDGEGVLATSQPDYFKVSATAEYFYKFNPKWTAYSKMRLSTSNNNYLDAPFALGDNTGVRGYPNDYQYGDNQWLLSAEIRNYPNINLYQLAELGWALFTDVGQASGGPDHDNEVSGPIGSVGIGARIYSSRSSYGSVAHIDLTLPFTSGAEVNRWEWRLQVRSHF
ncbi:ShlB/FhaC/HecB family hemolysin secretion/activation protein [Shewanella marisflavi]|uniref:ShlB/FhaC/HecB family hemolysin secretion/activation protein n=1 Tax=Shewanella marisflavi TaxID=260364 RepID=UPI003D161262